ncbi:TetR family transcriptional regulator [Candidatus Mycobacterium methanotrophicum]|uniref:TetR family transcriptional regulator n=2 Tax=Candidatus Mycobacterium methanotrophicum TaxID=2943498 RepID=A0ABY4QPS0_9MYCO|nr:TetR family transcriptional regulator [Candidatus Mycobacterium methanotrophicum]UQX11955.1 TetR family transcriptional regulator [Candidatus Mycobacterium methanotrophicum]
MDTSRRTQAARPLLAAQGFAEVALETIVRAAGVTRGALYHHFADKTELFAAVFEQADGEVADAANRGDRFDDARRDA